MPVFEAYHGVSGDEHQRRFDRLSVAGYRMISLSVYGPPQSARYAAVWVERAGPEYVAFHGRSADDYQSLVDSLTPQGFVPILLSATGGGGDAIFAGVFEQLRIGWAGRHGITADVLGSENAAHTNEGLMLRELCCYGDVNQPLYAAVWQQESASVHESWWISFDGGTYQQLFDAVKRPGNRPFLVAVSDGPRYHALFRDDSLAFRVARHGIDAATYQSEFDQNLLQDRMPVAVRAAGLGDPSQDVYAAVFAASDQVEARQWSVTGTHHSQFDAIEGAIRMFMQTRGIRAGTLAIGHRGQLVCSRGFTLAEAGYPICPPDALFRLASLSKLFTAAAIGALQAAVPIPRKLHFLQQHIFGLLGISTARLPGQTPDSRSHSITLGQLIDHQGGWRSNIAIPSLHPGLPPGFDPCSSAGLRLIGRDLGYNHVVSPMDVATYMFGEPLQYTPGTSTLPVDQRYSNLGYLLLGLAVETLARRPYYDYLRDAVLTPISVTDVFVANPLSARPREVSYHCVNAVPSVFRPDLDPAWVAEPYGGLGTETAAASGGLLASAPAVATTISHHAVWGLGPRAPGFDRIGDMPGTFTCASSRANGYDLAILFNGNDGLDDSIRGQFLNTVKTAIDGLP